MELGLILGRNLEKPGKRQNLLGVFQGFSRSNFAFLPFSRFFQVFQGFPGHLATLIIAQNFHSIYAICSKIREKMINLDFVGVIGTFNFKSLNLVKKVIKNKESANTNFIKTLLKYLYKLYSKECILYRNVN